MSDLDRTFAALADPTRRAILARLAHGEATVGQLAAPFAMSLPAVSKHLRLLENASLIVRDRPGPNRVCRLRPCALREASEWMNDYRRFWEGALDRLEARLVRNSDRGADL